MITFKTPASEIFATNVNNSAVVLPAGSSLIDAAAAAAIAAANTSTAVGQSVSELEFAPSTDVTPFTVVEPGLQLPCDQLEDEDARCQ